MPAVRVSPGSKDLGLRPYWVHVLKENVLSWRTAREAGHTVLQQIVIRETSR